MSELTEFYTFDLRDNLDRIAIFDVRPFVCVFEASSFSTCFPSLSSVCSFSSGTGDDTCVKGEKTEYE